MRGPSFVPCDLRATVVQILTYQDQNLQGTLRNLALGDEQGFSSSTQLLLLLDQALDQLNLAQAATASRSFGGMPGRGSPAETSPPPESNAPPGSSAGGMPGRGGPTDPADSGEDKPLASFKINVLFRQHSSWQGTIRWLEKEQETSFRSVLELLKIIDSALQV